MGLVVGLSAGSSEVLERRFVQLLMDWTVVVVVADADVDLAGRPLVWVHCYPVKNHVH